MNRPNLEQLYSSGVWKPVLDEKRLIYQGVVPALYDATRLILDSEHDKPLLAIAHLAYGWMPRMLGIPEPMTLAKRGKEIADQIRKIQTPGEAHKWLENAECPLDKPAVNRSWVGTSKTLHLISPQAFPIWDSVVARVFDITTQHHVERRTNFLEYVSFVADSVNLDVVKRFSEDYEKALGHAPSPVRAVEYLLYCSASRK